MRSTLLILVPGFATDEADSTCLPFVQSFIRTLNRLYPELSLIIIPFDYPHTTQEYNWHGNRVIPLNGESLKPRPLLWLKLYRRLRQLHKQNHLKGVLNCWCADNALVTHYFSKWNKIKHYTFLQGQDAKKENKILKFFRPQGKNMIALSDFLQQEFQRNHHVQPVYVIYPGIEKDRFSNSIDKKIHIIGIGSLIKLKQFDVLVSLVEKLKEKIPDIQSAIIGKGPEEDHLRKMIKEKKLEEHIHLYGELPHDSIPAILSQVKLLVHPSAYEGYGIVCLEALASGCHVVSFVSPEEKKIEHWNVVKDFAEMYECAEEILSLPREEFYPVVPHTIEDTVKRVMQLYS